MYKTVLCFEMSSSLFSRLYGNTQFLVKTLRELHRSKLQTIKTFLFVQLYTPKRLWFWLHKSQVKKISQCQRPRKTHHTFIPYHACSRTEPATFGSPRARDSRAGSERVDFVFKSNSTITFWSEIRFLIGCTRPMSEIFGNVCCLLPVDLKM